jgi:hypothetical protein
MGLILIAAGIVAIVAGILAREFTVADVDALAEFKPSKKSSTWSGRAVFIGVGAGMILIGIGIIFR